LCNTLIISMRELLVFLYKSMLYPSNTITYNYYYAIISIMQYQKLSIFAKTYSRTLEKSAIR